MNEPLDDRLDTRREQNSRLIEEERIPLVEERLVLQRRERKRTVTVTTRPVTEQVKVSQPIRRETVTVERVPIGRVVDAAPPVREDPDLTVIPVLEERVRVVRELVLVEEIHLRRTRRDVMHEETVARTRTEVDVEEGPWQT
jgi:stress response protein YsnF